MHGLPRATAVPGVIALLKKNSLLRKFFKIQKAFSWIRLKQYIDLAKPKSGAAKE